MFKPSKTIAALSFFSLAPLKRTYLASTILLTSLALGVGCPGPAKGPLTDTGDSADSGGESRWCVIIDLDIVQDTTLGADDCYVVEGDRDVTAELTIEPGVTLQFDAGASLNIDDKGGALIANGTAAEPIVFTGTQSVKGFWKGVWIQSNSPLNSMKFVTVEYGGNDELFHSSDSYPANLFIFRDSRIVIEDCTLSSGSAHGLGIYETSADITSFARNTFAGNEGPPIRLPADHVTLLDADSDFAGGPGMENGEPNIVVFDDLTVKSTWLDHGVPYLFAEEETDVEADLTLNPGVTLIFPEDGRMRVESDGALNAVGTASKPITFTSTTQVAGYWRGISISSSSPLNVMEYVDIGWGAREKLINSSDCEPANITLNSEPSRLTITNSNIHDSLGWGIFVRSSGDITETGNTYSSNATGNVNFVQ